MSLQLQKGRPENVEVMKYYDFLPFKDLIEAENQVSLFIKLLEKKSMIRWGIEYKENGKLIGTCGFFALSEDSKKAEMGVWFAHPFLMKKSFAADRLFGIMELLIGGSNPLRFYR